LFVFGRPRNYSGEGLVDSPLLPCMVHGECIFASQLCSLILAEIVDILPRFLELEKEINFRNDGSLAVYFERASPALESCRS
jgi:hypothetical protein